MKHITLKIIGSDNDPFDILLRPGVTVRELLDATGLQGGRYPLFSTQPKPFLQRRYSMT